MIYEEEHDRSACEMSGRRTTHVARGVSVGRFQLVSSGRRSGRRPTCPGVDISNNKSKVDYIEPDSAPWQITTMAMELLCPPVVTQTRPMEGCDQASPHQLRRGRDVLTEDGTVAVDTRQVSASSDTVVVSGIHMMSECIPTVTPKLAAAPQAAS